MSLLEKCRDLTEDATLHTLAQSIYLWSLCDSLEKLGEDRSIEKYYLDSKLAQFTGHASLGDIDRMFFLSATYVPPVLLGGSSYINGNLRPSNRPYIAVSGMNIDLRVKYTSLNVKLGDLIPSGKFLLSTNEEIVRVDEHKFAYFHTKQKKKLTKTELLHSIKDDLKSCPACNHGSLTIHIIGVNSAQTFSNLMERGLDVSSVVDNLFKDMRFKPERKHSKKG